MPLRAPLVALSALCLGACAGSGDTTTEDGGSPVEDTTGLSADTDAAGPMSGCLSDFQCGFPTGVDAACNLVVCADGACVVLQSADLTPCDDGDPCTSDDARCSAGACGGGSPASCADANPCTADACDPVTGCLHDPRPDGEACDDGDPCTEGDACADGVCLGDAQLCPCQSDGDCAAYEDDNACNGTLACDGVACALAADSVVICPEPGACRVAACAPATGACTTLLAPNGTPCDDGNPCTVADACQAGVCGGQSGACACSADADCKVFQGGTYDLCQGPLVCVDGSCAPDPEDAVMCVGEPDADTPCLTTACDAGTGLCATVAMPDGAPCPADDPCEAAAACAQGVCAPAAADCDDGDPCTIDTCIAGVGCESVPTGGPCDDGDPCTEGETCAGGECAGGSGVVCDDLNPCTTDLCASGGGGCVATPVDDGADCEGGDPCQVGGWCEGGECVGQVPLDCPEPGPCQTSACVTGQGCTRKPVPDGAACETGLACDQPGACDGGVCVALPSPCKDGNPCTVDTCDTETGLCVHQEAAEGAQCNPKDPCLVSGTCQAGACLGGAPFMCPPGACTVKTCDSAAGGCVAVANLDDGTPCGQLGPCLDTGVCEDGFCKGAGPVNCDDDDPCTLDACDPATSECEHAALSCEQPSAPCQEAACDGSCVIVDSPECLDGEVLWSTSFPCGAAVSWGFEPETGGFDIDHTAPPGGGWDNDCGLHSGAPGAAATATSPSFSVTEPDSLVRVSFVSWYDDPGSELGVELLQAGGPSQGSQPVSDDGEAQAWSKTTLEPWSVSTPGTYRLRFTVGAAAPTWFVDKIVVTLLP